MYDETGCFNSASVYVQIVGIDETNGDFNFFVYPNPSSNMLYVELPPGLANEMKEIELVNVIIATTHYPKMI